MIATANKIKSRPTYVCPKTLAVYYSQEKNTIKFPSTFEAKVYKELRILGLEVQCQAQLLLVPVNATGRYKKPLTWKIDFLAKHPHKTYYIPVEAKGNWVHGQSTAKEALRKTLRLLEWSDAEAAKRLIIVSPTQAYKIDELHTTVPFRQLREVITQAFELI